MRHFSALNGPVSSREYAAIAGMEWTGWHGSSARRWERFKAWLRNQEIPHGRVIREDCSAAITIDVTGSQLEALFRRKG